MACDRRQSHPAWPGWMSAVKPCCSTSSRISPSARSLRPSGRCWPPGSNGCSTSSAAMWPWSTPTTRPIISAPCSTPVLRCPTSMRCRSRPVGRLGLAPARDRVPAPRSVPRPDRGARGSLVRGGALASVLTVRVHVQGQTVGAFHLGRVHAGGYGAIDIALAEQVAGQLGVALAGSGRGRQHSTPPRRPCTRARP